MADFFCLSSRENFVMDLSKLTIGDDTFGLTMPILLLLFFTAVAGGVAIALGSTRRTALMVVIAAVILLISGYCLFLACNSVLHTKKTVKVEQVGYPPVP